MNGGRPAAKIGASAYDEFALVSRGCCRRGAIARCVRAGVPHNAEYVAPEDGPFMKIKQIQFSAGLEADALTELRSIDPHVVLVFGSIDILKKPDMDRAFHQAFPRAAVLGCSTAGEITARGVYEKTCVVSAFRFERGIGLKSAEASIPVMEDSRTAGESIGRQLAGPGLRAVLLFGKGVGVNGSAVIEGLISRIGPKVPVTGGLAGDDGAFAGSLTVTPSGIRADAVVGLGLYGDDLIVGHGSYGGWVPFGPARKVTRSEGNVLYELDGEPALNVYKRYLGDYAKDLPASGLLFPFEMLNENHDAMGLVRSTLAIDETQGSLVLAGDIVANGYLRLMHASTTQLVDGADVAARQVRAFLPQDVPPGLAILVSCVGRRLVMGDQVDDEVDVVANALGQQNALTGFYSYGEISPFTATTDCKLHNQTMTVTYLGER
jgi:hypothetical protein